MYKLHWVAKSWNTPPIYRDTPNCMVFNTLDEIIQTMSKCTYNGEWITDKKW